MSRQVNVDPELVAQAAGRADAELRVLLDAHGAASAAIDSALRGWVGESAAALSAATGRWAAATSEVGALIAAHAEALRISGLTLSEMAVRHTARLAAVHRPEPGR